MSEEANGIYVISSSYPVPSDTHLVLFRTARTMFRSRRRHQNVVSNVCNGDMSSEFVLTDSPERGYLFSTTFRLSGSRQEVTAEILLCEAALTQEDLDLHVFERGRPCP